MKRGQIFTPRKWAEWALDTSGAYKAWQEGAVIMDPTCGQGIFLKAIADRACKEGPPPSPEALNRLMGIEIDKNCLQQPDRGFRLIHADILLTDPLPEADFLIGNPPWITYADIPLEQRDRWQPLFLQYHLARTAKEFLLGGSRIDISALILIHLFSQRQTNDRKAFFFLPLSLFFDGGAHGLWRKQMMSLSRLTDIYDLTTEKAFPGIGTRYGAASFIIPSEPAAADPAKITNEIILHTPSGMKQWKTEILAPPSHEKLPYMTKNGTAFQLILDRSERPRQGLNTGGANKIFFLNQIRQNPETGEITGINGYQQQVTLPRQVVSPLITAKEFRQQSTDPAAAGKAVILPHHPETGKPYTEEQLSAMPELNHYLRQHEAALKARRGTMLGSFLRRGLWWALMGVGPYSFAPWKVVWEAYGRSRFKAQIFPAPWQPNQALQAFIPCKTVDEAQRIAGVMNEGPLEEILHAQKGEGSCNWAQPGKIIPWIQWTD